MKSNTLKFKRSSVDSCPLPMVVGRKGADSDIYEMFQKRICMEMLN